MLFVRPIAAAAFAALVLACGGAAAQSAIVNSSPKFHCPFPKCLSM